jgi:precorrin-6Y C5,15-methyltransferase (decarboxylating) CbiT subunit
MRDEWFIRGDVPMTKSEVRAVSLSKLELAQDSIFYDIGAGTGSVSIEAARMMPNGTVYAIEKNSAAIELLKKNREHFQTENLVLVEGEAPDVLQGLPTPTHAFLGGSGGKILDILNILLQKNPDVRVVINVIALESLSKLMESLRVLGKEPEIVLVQVAKAKKLGTYHLMQGQNPVYVISFGGAKEGEY